MNRCLAALAVVLACLRAAQSPVSAEPAHAIAMHGTPALPSGFDHFPYTDPAAPKGGRLTLGVNGTFDSFNPFIIKGVPAAGLRDYVYETLMARGLDEPFTLYGLLADSIDVPADRSSVTFHLDDKARFSDGTPLTPADVIFSFEILRDRGRPNHRAYYKKVSRVETPSARDVRFVLDGMGDREMPLILGLMPILPKHKFTPESFDQTSLVPPTGSGPYRIERTDAGRSLVYVRDPNYWGRDLPVNRGRFNFDEIRYEYYRDASAMFEAFKTGEIDLRLEEDPSNWAEGYAIPAVADGRIVKAEIPTGLPAGMTGLVFNTRRPVFQDHRVRRALNLAFDFEWANKRLYHGLYSRTQSYFERSYLSSHGRPADARERELLAPWISHIDTDLLEGRFEFPTGSATGYNRDNQRKALALLGEAGYTLRLGHLVDKRTGAPMRFEMLAATVDQERLFGGFVADLKRLGIDARVRLVDSAQYQSRIKSYDYDMLQVSWPVSLSPGNEQLFRWSAEAGRNPGSYNYAGVADPAADAMIQAMLEATEPANFVSAVRALDRVLLSGDYCIPLFYLPKQWLAYWRRLKGPARSSLFGFQPDTWWSDDAR